MRMVRLEAVTLKQRRSEMIHSHPLATETIEKDRPTCQERPTRNSDDDAIQGHLYASLRFDVESYEFFEKVSSTQMPEADMLSKSTMLINVADF